MEVWCGTSSGLGVQERFPKAVTCWMPGRQMGGQSQPLPHSQRREGVGVRSTGPR